MAPRVLWLAMKIFFILNGKKGIIKEVSANMSVWNRHAELTMKRQMLLPVGECSRLWDLTMLLLCKVASKFLR